MTGMPVHFETISAMSSSVTSSLQHRAALLHLRELRVCASSSSRCSCGDRAVAHLGGAFEVALALGARSRPRAELLELRLQLADLRR